MKRLFTVALATLMVLSCLCACEKTESTDDPVEPSPSVDEPVDDEVAFVTDGVANFIIKSESGVAESVATKLVNFVKSKTDVTLEIYGFVPSSYTGHVIYIGKKYSSVFPDATEKPTANGYAFLEKDGDLYVFGEGDVKLAMAMQKLFDSITGDCVIEKESGKKSLIIPKSLFFIYNPSNEVENAKLLSVDLSEYRLVYPKDSSTDYQLALLLQSQFATKTGVSLEIVKDSTAAVTHEILIGDTSRSPANSLAKDAYSVKSKSGKICLQYGCYLGAESALTALISLLKKDTSSGINESGKITELQCVEKESGVIRVMSSNAYFGNYSLPQTTRADILAECYTLFNPDFIGMQESKYMAQYVMSTLKGYASVSQTTGHTPILYKTSSWQIAKNTSGQEIKGVTRFNGHCWSLEWVMFQSKTDSTVKVIVMNLHLHPRSGEYSSERSNDIDKTNATWKELLEDYPNVPIFCTGDYNSATNSDDFSNLLSGLENTLGEGKLLATDQKSVSDSKLYTYHKSEGTNTAYSGDGIDHIVVTKNLVEVKHYRVIQYNPIGYASDHFPIFVDVVLK